MATCTRSPPSKLPDSIRPTDQDLDQVELDAALQDDIVANPEKWAALVEGGQERL